MNVYHWFDFTLVGLDNYIRALFVFDSGFLSALLATILWTVVSMILQLVIAFLLANLLNIEKLRLRKLYKTVLMFPWAMPGYVGILLWKTGMFNTQFGLLNQWMDKLGLTAVKWLSSDVSAFLSCTVVNLWLALPFMIMIMDGALQSIDKSYYESAILDGAGAFARAKYITIPAMRPIIAPAVIITVFTTFKQFDVVYLLTQQAGAKTGSGFHTILTYAYENAFITNNYGYSSAISMIIFAASAPVLRKIPAEGGCLMTKRRWREGVGLTALNAFFIALCFLTLIPILYALSVSFNGSNSLLSSDFSFIPRNFTLKNYREVLFGENITLWFRNTVFLAVVTVFLSLLVAVPAAYCFSRRRFPGRKAILRCLVLLEFFPGDSVHVRDLPSAAADGAGQYPAGTDPCLYGNHGGVQPVEHQGLL